MPEKEQNQMPDISVSKPSLQTDYTWYNSLFTQLIAPLFGMRYLFEAVEDINPHNILQKNEPKADTSGKPWKDPGMGRYASLNFISYGMGALFAGIMFDYSRRTLNDIKSLYAEAVGYELGKKTEDVTLTDVFFTSKNAALEVTRNAYRFRTLARAATAATFFVPWEKMRFAQKAAPKYEANAKVGVGAIAAYIYGEGFLREPSFFDIEQKMVSVKVNHKDTNPYVRILAEDVQGLMILQRKHLNSVYQRPPAASEEGQHDIALAERMTELLNQTYENIPRTEPANFTIGKFNYLIGFGLLDKFPESMAFVELANRSSDMSEVKQAAAAIKGGKNPAEVFKSFGVDMTPPAEVPLPAAPAESKFADREKPMSKPSQPKTHMEHAAQASGSQLAV